MKNYLFLLILLLGFSLNALAQETLQISGKVTDAESDEPLIGVSISVIGKTGLGAITDDNGKYEIEVKPYRTLAFTYIGYDTVQVLVKKQNTVNVSLQRAKARAIDEVVVTATGPEKRISVTGAVTSVDMEDMKKSSTLSLSIVNSFAGNVPGILAQQTSGQPGKDISNFWVRGISTFGGGTGALVLVDGFERDINEININDIKSISVLKDASATAMYGSRGANGVILITTKHGKAGKPNINLRVEGSYNTRTITPKFVDGPTYAGLINESRTTRDHPPLYSSTELRILKLGLDPDLYPNVDWMDKVLRDGAYSYSANVSASGGGNTARYYVSGSYLDEQGMYKTDKELKKDYNTNADYKKWTYRLNTDVNITPSTLVKLGVSGSLRKRNSPGLGDNDVWGELFGYSPIRTPIEYSNGYIPAVGTGNKTNPWVANTQTGFNVNWESNVQTNITVNQDFNFLLKGLTFNGSFGYDTYNNNNISRHRWPEQWKAERHRDVNGQLVFHHISDPGDLEQSSNSDGSRREFLRLMFNYNKDIGSNHFGGTVKYTQDAYISTQNLGDDLKNGVPKKHQGIAGRVRYNWMYKYFIDFNFGYTGSQNFAIGHQFGFFPAFSAAWNIGEEQFVKDNLSWINMFKIRASYGRVGNDDLGGARFPYLYSIDGGKGGYEWAKNGLSKFYEGRGYSQVASPYVTWEVSTKRDIGTDISLFDDAFFMKVDYFSQKRTGIYMSRDFLPVMVGLESTPSANVGVVTAKGFDGNFKVQHQFGTFNLAVRGNITYSKNEILDRDEERSVYPYQMQKGYRVGQLKGLVALGLFDSYEEIRNSPTQEFGPYQPGDIKYKDINGDGVVNGDDQVAVGATSTPNMVYGLGFSISSHGVDLNVLFQGAGKSNFFIYGKNVYAFTEGEWGNVFSDLMKNRWIPEEISGDPSTENPNASYPRLSYEDRDGNNYRNSTFWIRDGRYIRLKNVNIGYTFPNSLVNRLHISNARIYLRGSNLLTWAPFKVWDPEMASPRGEDYPPSRTFNLGLSLTF